MFRDLASAARSFGTWHLPKAAPLVRWLVDLDSRHRQRTALSRLDDRLLRDMGLSQADIEAEVGGVRAADHPPL